MYLLEHPRQMLAATVMTIVTQPLRFLLALRLLFQLLRNSRFAVVRHVFYLCEACLLARQLRQRGVQWLHNHIAENSASVAMLTSAISGIPYSLTVHGPGIFYHPQQQSLGLKIGRSSFTACISEFCRSQSMVFTDPEYWHRLKIVRCSVGPEFLDAAVTSVPACSQWVCVGRFCPEKGHLILLEATKQLVDEGLNPKIVLIGDGELRSQIEDVIQQHQLQDHVTLMGWQSSRVVTEQLRASRGLVMASFAEGLPVVCMESLAMGRPVIATRIAGIPELVQDEVNGWLVNPSSAEALREAMRASLSCSAESLNDMGANGRQSVATNHDPAKQSLRLLQFIECYSVGPQ